MAAITSVKGDATCPLGSGVKIICHVCNDLGGWGKGFVLAVSARWPGPEAAYRDWHASGAAGGFALGAVQFVPVGPYIWVANMIAQRGTKTGSSGPPIRYPAVEACLGQVAKKAAELAIPTASGKGSPVRPRASVHMPRIGCGLAGGEWDQIEPLIDRQLVAAGVPVTVYDFA